MFYSIILILFNSISFALQYDNELSDKLNKKYKELICETETGKRFYERFDTVRKNKLPKTLLRFSNENGLAWYEIGKDTIYLNTKYIMLFFDVKGYKESRIIKAFNTNPQIIDEFTRYSDTLYLHELIHCLQDSLYGKARYMKEGGMFLEFEYEAYFISDLYFHEKMKKNKELFKKIIAGEYYDIYTTYDLMGYLSISLNPDDYRKEIEKRYLNEMSGYLSLEQKEQILKTRLSESKILSYASGDQKKYILDKKDYSKLQRQKKEYAVFLSDFFNNNWPGFSYEALNYILEIATTAKNYPLALDVASSLEISISTYNISAADEIKLKESAALTILQAQNYIRDNYKKMKPEILFYHLFYLEKACIKTNRQFDENLILIRKENYENSLKYFLKKYSSEKDEMAKETYKNYIDFINKSLKDNYGISEEN
jgi:hypothetical protein